MAAAVSDSDDPIYRGERLSERRARYLREAYAKAFAGASGLLEEEGALISLKRRLFVRLVRHAVGETFDVGSVVGAEECVVTVLVLFELGLFPGELVSELPDWLAACYREFSVSEVL